MATKVIQWNTGTGNITLTYTGEGDGTIVVSSDQNNLSVARSQQITVKTTDGSKSQTVTISQAAYVRNYLKFTALESGTFTLTIPDSVTATQLASISYSLDNGATWVTTQNTSSAVTITTPTVAQGGTVLWKGSGIKTARSTSGGTQSIFSSTGNFECSGNIMSLLYEDAFENKLSITEDSCFARLFYNCSTIVTPPELPATSISTRCYASMFTGCTSLTTAPELPATTAPDACYDYMFKGCSSLESAPELPATTLYTWCYEEMFNGCSNLKYPPSVIPANSIPNYGCYAMFANCRKLLSAPDIYATSFGSHSCELMFNYCSSLVVAPNIHPTVVAPYCCNNMFWACTSLTTAPTTLPATTLAEGCYRYMFDECRNLENTPELPALTLVSNCYLGMFHNCNKINHIKAMFTTTPSNSYTQNWVQNVASTGTFVKNVEATWDVRGNNGIPTNWTVETAPRDYLKFTALESGTFSLVLPAAVNANLMTSVSYSVDNGATWVTTTNDNTDITITTPTIAAGDSVLWKGTGVRTANNSNANNFSNFSSTGSFAASGNIMSLLLENTFENEKVLPNAYYTFLKLFLYCTGMTTPPELPATTLRNSCYNSMFDGCTSLTSMPELPATTLAESCYQSMFYGCGSLQKAPDLPALTLVQGCYYQMFMGCGNMTSLKCLATDISAGYCTNMWLYNVANSGTFIKNAEMSSWTRGANGIPEGWTVEDADD